MQKQAPTFGRILTMVLFALSCFGLLLFLWLSFGGAIPLKPKGYRFKVAFPEATQLGLEADVRMAGVSVGKVRGKELDPHGQPHARRRSSSTPSSRRCTPREGDPAPEDAARGDLRRADAGHARHADDPRGRAAEQRAGQPTVELDEIFRPSTRRRGRPSAPGSRTWRERSPAAARTSTTRSATCRPSPPTRTDVLEVLDEQGGAVRRLIRNTGVRVRRADRRTRTRCTA